MSIYSIYAIKNLYSNFKESREKLKQKAIDEYNAALKMPRKKKKQAKKSALLLYSVACWNPLNI